MEKALNRDILKIAVPAIVTNITTPLLGLVDIAIVGHFGSAAYIGAIAVGSSIVNMAYWLLNFLRAGTSGLTAQAVGAENTQQSKLILFRGAYIGLALGLLLLLLSPLISSIVIPFMEADAPTSVLAEKYFTTVIWGAPPFIATYALTGWLLGKQNAVATLKIAVVTNILNILLSLTFVWIFNWKIEGVAAGTAISQWIGAGYAMWLIYRKYHPSGIPFATLFKKAEVGRFFKINIEIFFRTACLVAVTVWFTRTGASLGTDILAANSILMQFFMLFSFFMDGFAYAGEALGGKFYGAGDFSKLHRLIKYLMIWGVSLAFLGIAIYFFFGEWIISFLTDEVNVRTVAKDFLPWAVTIPLMGFMAFIYDGVFIGMTLTRQMLIAMAAAMGVYFLLYFLLKGSLGNHALWLAFSAYLLVRGFAQMLLIRLHRSSDATP